MNILDLLADKVLDIPLMEMAYERKVVIRKIDDLSMQLAIHVAKIFTVNNPRDKKHWIGEVNGWLYTINSWYVDRRKKLPFSVYYRLLWEGPLGHEDSVLAIMQKQDKYQYTITKHTQTDVQQMYIAVCHDLAGDKPIKIENYLP